MYSNPPAKHLRLVSVRDSTSAESPTLASANELLRAVLDAKLTPTLTVEQACHLDIPYLAQDLPPMEKFLADLNMLRSAGLDIRVELDEPEAIVLIEPQWFEAKFPKLVAAIPVMLASGGVQPYTNGLPRKTQVLRSV